MSIASEISRISQNVSDSLTAVAAKGVTVPSGSTSDDLPELIAAIQTGSGSAITITDTTDSHGGIIRTITGVSLAGDTVTAAHLESGYTAHDSLGNAITGTLNPGTGGVDCPTFNVIYDSTWQTVQSITCDKTFAQCLAYLDESDDTYTEAALVNMTDTLESYVQLASATVANEGPQATSLDYYIGSGWYGVPIAKITYTSTGTLTWTSYPIAINNSDDLTASGATVTAPAGFYENDATKTIASGSATTPATTVTANPSITVGSDGLITATASATKSVTPTVSAGYVASGTAGTITVSGSNTSQLSTQAGTTISPTESEQTAVAAGKYTTGAVKVGAISSTYVGSGITQRSSTDLTASGATVTVPAGYYASQATKSVSIMTLPTSASSSATSGYTSKATISRSTSDQYINIPTGYNSAGAYYKVSAVANGSATGPTSLSGSSATVSTGTNTITLTKTGVTTTPTVSAGYVSSATASTATVALTASVTTKAATTYHPSTSDQTIASGTYTTGTQTIKAVTHNLDASKILSGTTIKIGDSSDDDCVASVAGTVTFQTIYSGSSAPSSSTGVNGDVYIQTA